MTDRIEAADPDAILLIYWLLICSAAVGVSLLASWRLRKRNRYLTRLPQPRPDMRSSIEYSKRHMPEGKR